MKSVYLKEYKNGRFSEFGIEISSYLTNLQIDKTKKTDICFISNDFDCLTINEIVEAAGYDPLSILNHKLLITIENDI